MTCIAMIETEERLTFAADTFFSNNWVGAAYDRSKLVENAGLMIGGSGSARVLDVMEYAVEVPPHHPNTLSDRGYLVGKVVPAIIEALEDGKCLRQDDGHASLSGSYLIGYRGRGYELQDDLSVLRPRPILTGTGIRIGASGSGGEHAYSYLVNQLRVSPERADRPDGIKDLLREAIEVAADRVVSVNGAVEYRTQGR